MFEREHSRVSLVTPDLSQVATAAEDLPMHELAIADSILELAMRHAGARRIAVIEVRVGHLRQVVPDALRFSFALLAEGGAADGAELRIEEVPPAGRCARCGARGPTVADWPLRCTRCGSPHMELTEGEELLVTALEVQDDVAIEEVVAQ